MEILRRCGATKNQGSAKPVFKGRRQERLNYNGLLSVTKKGAAFRLA